MEYQKRGLSPTLNLPWMRTALCLAMALSLLIQGNVSMAETDLLNLSAYSEGETPSYAENMTVVQDETTGVKYLSSREGGKLSFPVNLSGDFGMVIKLISNSFSDQTLYLLADEHIFKIIFYRYGVDKIFFEDDETEGDNEGWRKEQVNTLEFTVTGRVVKLTINDIFWGKLNSLNPDLTYTQLSLRDLRDEDAIYGVTLSGEYISDFQKGKQAGIQQCVFDPLSCGIDCSDCTPAESATFSINTGELYIPIVNVLEPLGGSYEVYLQQKPLTFTFDLDMERIERVSVE